MLAVYSLLLSWKRSLGRNEPGHFRRKSGIAETFYSELNPKPQLIYFPGTGAGARTMHGFSGGKGWSQSRSHGHQSWTFSVFH